MDKSRKAMNNKLEPDFSGINLVYEATIYQGKASTVYRCKACTFPFS